MVGHRGETSSSAAPSPAPGDLLAGRFALERQIGRGGAGTVFAAFDTKVGQRVAVKVLHADIRDADQLERLRREVRASRPGHPSAVAVFDLFDDGRRRFLTMELVEGRSLGLELGDAGRLGVDATVEVGRQVAAAIADLHAKGLVHRDVKPGNVLLTPKGVAKLCDMGLVRSTTRGMTITETEMVVGTPAYMAPEQALAGDLTAASDVYALGLTLYQCLAGEVPLEDDTAVATLMLRQRSRPPRVRSVRRDCPAWLDRLIRWMLEPAPGDRPSAVKVEQALARRRLRRSLRPTRRQLAVGSIAALMVAFGVAGWRALSHWPAAGVEVDGSDVVGRDDAGRELWRYALDQPLVDVARADLDGDGADEVLVTGQAEHTGRPLPGQVRSSEIVVLDAAGRVITRIVPERAIGEWDFRYRLEVTPALFVIDVDDDGTLEVIANCRQRHYFPTVLLVYWPRWDTWDEVLRHPGSIYGLFPAAAGAGPGIRFVGVNNRLAMFMCFGVIDLVPPGARRQGRAARAGGLRTPPFSQLDRTPQAGWVDYAPFTIKSAGAASGAVRLEETPDGGLSIATFDGTARLDRFLNPADGPNAGCDLRTQRTRFFSQLYALKQGFSSFSADRIDRVRAVVTEDCGPLLADPSYEVMLLDGVARALARAGDLDGATSVLRPAFDRLANDDLGYLLASLEAIRGDLVSSSLLLRRLMDQGRTMRAGFDAPRLLIRVAIESRDDDVVASSVSYLHGRFRIEAPLVNVASTLRAGVRLWWDEVSAADTRVGSVDLVEDGDAVACLARWRRGASRPDDVDAMRLFIESNPDFEGIGRAALAAALLAGGRTAEALVECDGAAAMLDDLSRTDFAEYQNLQLVRAIRTVALLASGDRDLARLEARRLAEVVDRDLLPGILVAEVLAVTGV